MTRTALPALSWAGSGLDKAALKGYEARLAPELARLRAAAKSGYADDRASINLPLDKGHLALVRKAARAHKGASLVIVVGIGGSNLGTMAVQEAVLGRAHNLRPGKRARILYADTVDADALASTLALLDDALKAGEKVALNVVSKSGGTTESIANFEVLLAALQKRDKKSWRERVVATTDEGSGLWQLAQREGFTALPIPKKVGGRYSVFSPVGLFPLALLGLDVDALLEGAQQMRTACLEEKGERNPALVRAAMLAHARSQGIAIADNFYFASDLESVGKWYRQLMGESVGKEWDAAHKERLMMGITPTVSIGSTDLHSMAQLYFGGPRDKIHTLVTVRAPTTALAVPRFAQYGTLVPHIQGKRLPVIMDAIVQGVEAVLAQQQRPFCRIELADRGERSVGALLQLHMVEMMLLGALLDVNPFDQPNVEAYKVETKRVLAGGK